MTLEEIRTEIDEIDAQMRDLYVRRMGLSRKVAEVKAQTGDSIYKPEREKEVLKKCAEGMDPVLQPGFQEIMQMIMEISREYQADLILGNLRD